jgi:hypothetical protein
MAVPDVGKGVHPTKLNGFRTGVGSVPNCPEEFMDEVEVVPKSFQVISTFWAAAGVAVDTNPAIRHRLRIRAEKARFPLFFRTITCVILCPFALTQSPSLKIVSIDHS